MIFVTPDDLLTLAFECVATAVSLAAFITLLSFLFAVNDLFAASGGLTFLSSNSQS